MVRKALLVGINDYQQVNDLKGCINDVTNLRNILKTFLGFQNSDLRVLTDARATKANILTRLNWLVRGAKAGDFLLFQFSGHGSQIRDRDGDELSDHMDELICPFDMDWDGNYITDDDLRDIFKKLPQGVTLEVVLDSCHSGTGLRAAVDLGRPIEFGRPVEWGGSAELEREAYRRARYLPPPPDIVARWEGEEDLLEAPHAFRNLVRASTHQILWAGCKDFQTSADAFINGTYNGAFTYYFCRAMREAGGALARSELLRRVRQSLAHNRYEQIPQLECDPAVRNMKAFTFGERKTDGKVEGRAIRQGAGATPVKSTSLTAPPSRATSMKMSK